MGQSEDYQANELIEREKELDAVYALSSVITDPDIPQQTMLETCARLLLSALRWPDLSMITIIAPHLTAQTGGSCEHMGVFYTRSQDCGDSSPLHIECLCCRSLLEREKRLIDSVSLLIANALKSRLIRQQLEHKQIALREVLSQIEKNRGESTRKVSARLVADIIPFVRQLLHSGSLTQRERSLTEYLLQSLLNMDQPAATSEAMALLSPRQKEVCSLIRLGMSTKEIAEMLCISDQTVERHRNTIRKKLGLNGTKISLHEYLRKENV